jgi:hypothetical protein
MVDTWITQQWKKDLLGNNALSDARQHISQSPTFDLPKYIQLTQTVIYVRSHFFLQTAWGIGKNKSGRNKIYGGES